MKLLYYLLLTAFLAACQNETMPTSATDTVTSTTRTKRIVFFGNSLVAGYGLASRSESFVGRIAERIDSLDLNYEVVNAGVSGETTVGGLRRIDSVLQKPIDIFVLELGANDVFRGFSPDTTKNNLQRIINRVRAASPDAQIIIAGMKPPIYTGNPYIDRFGAIYEEVATENDALLVPFLLQGVALVVSLNQADRIHPNAAGHRVMAETVWEVLKPIL